jgi:glyoxylase-like metal-dependent hydrolase (beta-lactamase superfamily II)
MHRGYAWKSLFLRGGATKAPPVHELAEFSHGEVLDVPGQPHAIHTPGHTDGSSCLALPSRKVHFTGDALVTLSIVTGERTSRVMPGSVNKNSPLALESLNELKGLEAELILPGHGVACLWAVHGITLGQPRRGGITTTGEASIRRMPLHRGK